MLRIAPFVSSGPAHLAPVARPGPSTTGPACAFHSLGSTRLVGPLPSPASFTAVDARLRRWFHAFLDQGLAGLQSHFIGRPPPARSHDDSARPCDQTDTSKRLVPVVPFSVPEVRRIFNHLASTAPGRSDQFWHWSIYRRYKQALAMRSHYQRHGAKPPDFEYLRL